MIVRSVVPDNRDVELERLIDVLADPAQRSEPFARPVVDFCDRVSQALFASSTSLAFPEIQALAFWLRRASIEKLAQGFEAIKTPDTILVPRGFAFHVTPSNVDTIFVYSWVLSMLCGNTNLLRISQRSSPSVQVLCDVLTEILDRDEFSSLRTATAMVTYPHDAEITAAISARAELRILWGGDRTIEAIKAVPSPVAVKDIVFGDRYSFAVIQSARFLGLPADRKRALLQGFYNDAYWFGQMGCSSPRTVFWLGDQPACHQACDDFAQALQEIVSEKQYKNETGASLEVLNFAFAAAAGEGPLEIQRWSNELTVGKAGAVGTELNRSHCGHGFFFAHFADKLEDVIPLLSRRDQTMTYYGFEQEELHRFAQTLRGRGIDRIVPVGSALSFDRYWDGYDLLQEMTRRVFIGSDSNARYRREPRPPATRALTDSPTQLRE